MVRLEIACGKLTRRAELVAFDVAAIFGGSAMRAEARTSVQSWTPKRARIQAVIR